MKFLLSIKSILLTCFALNAITQSTGSSADLPPDLDANAIIQAFKQGRELATEDDKKLSPLPQNQGDAAVRQSIQQVLTPRSWAMERNQKVFEEATRVLAKTYNLTKEQIAQGLTSLNLEDALHDNTVEQCQATIQVSCDNVDSNYRTIDGSCNNMNNPTWGMSSSCFLSFTGAHYSDGISEFRKAISGKPLPDPRKVSLIIHYTVDRPSTIHPHMYMMIGQFIAHDISWTPASADGHNDSILCCPVKANAPNQCAPIIPPEGDPYYSQHNVSCLNNVRASICATCTLGPRSNTNQATSYIDLSHIYGFSQELADKHRANDGKGSLTTMEYHGMTLLPRSDIPKTDACSYQDPKLQCFSSGDVRVNQHPALTSMHTVFTIYHNLMSSALKEVNPHWDDEKLYQEARRILAAQFQMVVYGEFLPETLDPDTMSAYQLNVKESGYTQYDPSVNPSMRSEFSVATFRFGHSTIARQFVQLSAQRNVSDLTKDIFFFPFFLFNGGVEEFISGLTDSHSQNVQRFMTTGVTDNLYRERGPVEFGLDLASTDIQRGRDTGLPSYTEAVEFCGGPKIESFDDLNQLFRSNNSDYFKMVYESPKDIDLFSGGLSEKHLENGALGPTFSCIVASQFQLTKFGDHFYFEHGNQSSSFTLDQLDEIRQKTSLASILCQGSEITELQPNVLRYRSKSNHVVKCSEFPKININLWKEQDDDNDS